MQVPEFTVVDFNAGFGGRSLAFRDCGFSVVAAAESDPVKQEILRGIVPDIPIFTEPISLENLSSLPGTDILMADTCGEPCKAARGSEKGRCGFLSAFVLRIHFVQSAKSVFNTNSGCVGSG